MKKLYFIISSILIFLISNGIYAQLDRPICQIVEKVKKENKILQNRSYISYSSLDSNNNLNVFLINRTRKPLILSGFHRYINFDIQAKINGEWRNENIKLYCGTGYDKFILPANSYSYQKLNLENYQGNYQTQIRFIIPLDDTVIVSKNLAFNVDTTYFLKKQEYHLLKIESAIEQLPDSDIHKICTYQLRRARLLINLDRQKESIKVFEELINKYPEFYDGKYHYGRKLLKDLSKIEKEKKEARIKIMKKVVLLFKDIPVEYEHYKDIDKMDKIIKEEIKIILN